jgi:hypothetical protein
MCQLQVQLQMDKCSNIEAEGRVSCVTGRDKTLSYTVLPGKSGKYEITFDAVSFEMDAMTATCIPFDAAGYSDVDLGELEDGVSEMSEGCRNDRGHDRAYGGTDELPRERGSFDNGRQP